jgi:nucleoside-diphosphate-sugar epimerase
MARMRYVVTGGTGFIGRKVVSQILARGEDAEAWVLVRRASLARFERLAAEWGDRAKLLVGDLTAANLGLTDEAVAAARPAHPVASAVRRRSPSPNAARRYSRWRATPKRSTT